MPDPWIPILALSALIVLVLIRRARRLLTWQRFSPVRLGLRVGLIGVVSTLLLILSSLTKGFVPATGLAAGTLLGIFGSALTWGTTSASTRPC